MRPKFRARERKVKDEPETAVPESEVLEDDDIAVGTEEEEEEKEEEGLRTKSCTACHAVTTQMDVNQCPMCGNPFTP